VLFSFVERTHRAHKKDTQNIPYPPKEPWGWNMSPDISRFNTDKPVVISGECIGLMKRI
jgi:hypothetical protein